MATNPVISHRAIVRGLQRPTSEGGLESLPQAESVAVHEAIRRKLVEAGLDPAEATEMVGLFSEALDVLEKGELEPQVLNSVEHSVASLLQTYLAEKVEETAPPPEAGLEAKFDEHDLFGWIGSFFTWWRGIVDHAWQPPPAEPQPLHASFRAGVLGDWGTGLYGAPACARSMQKDSQCLNLLIHLGDVYYSGTETEIRERFLKFWPTVAGSVSRACNSNHEMYTGGHAYFDVTLAKFGQSSSCFAFQNEHWLLAGLDSAYKDFDLGMDQAAWLEGLVAAAGSRKVVLFSHHQPYSLLDKQGTNLVTRLRNLLQARRIFAWYWGHEHRCVLYDAHPLWGLHGRCIGHGGYPYFRTTPEGAQRQQSGEGFVWLRLPGRNLVPGGLLLDGPNPYVEGEAERYGPNGYAVLEFDGPNLTEQIHDADGREVFSQRLT